MVVCIYIVFCGLCVVAGAGSAGFVCGVPSEKIEKYGKAVYGGNVEIAASFKDSELLLHNVNKVV